MNIKHFVEYALLKKLTVNNIYETILTVDLNKLAKNFRQHNILIGGVEQDGVWKVAVGLTEIQPHNRVVAVCSSQHLNKVRQLFN